MVATSVAQESSTETGMGEIFSSNRVGSLVNRREIAFAPAATFTFFNHRMGQDCGDGGAIARNIVGLGQRRIRATPVFRCDLLAQFSWQSSHRH